MEAPVASPRPDSTPSVVVFVVAYQAEATIEAVLDGLPTALDGARLQVLVSDDCSTDRTADKAEKWVADHDLPCTTVAVQPRNLGYGANQKFGYRWAADAGADVVVLVHGDLQHPGHLIPELIAPIMSGTADAVYGSRMLVPGGPKAGGMPLTRRVGNRSLTWLQNAVAGTHFTEWHSGFRAYRLSALAAIDLAGLPDGFDFDPAATFALLDAGLRIREVPVPTRYADELSRVQPVRTGFRILGGALRRAVRSRPAPPAPEPADRPASAGVGSA